jgi:hypothetical protein
MTLRRVLFVLGRLAAVPKGWTVGAAAAAAVLSALLAASTPAVASVLATGTQPVASVLATGTQPVASPNSPSAQGVIRFVVQQRRLFAGGQSWGSAGPYERLDGTAYMQLDPRDPHNDVIVNLDKAPRDSQGMVEFSSPFFILKPVDMRRGNHRIFFGINNRGNKLESSSFYAFPNGGVGNNNPLTDKDVGDGLLLRQGYTIVDAGWQGDVAPGNNRLVPNFPVATQPDGSPIVARVRIEYSDRTIPAGGTFTMNLEGNPAFRSYPTAVTDTSQSTLTVGDTTDSPGVPIPSKQWAFGSCPSGQASLVPTTTDICLFGGFRPDKIYHLIYPAKNPIVMGLGYAVIRDIGSFLRYQTKDAFGDPNPLDLTPTNVGIQHAYSSGISSTAMFQRDWLYLGFNADLANRKVFDGVIIDSGGSYRLFANVEFADPNTYSRQDDRHDFLSASYPPLTFAVTTDPISGIHDGIVKRPATDPKVFQIDNEAEFWQWHASLNVIDGAGNPVPIPDNVRLYQNTGFSHIGVAGLLSPPNPRGICQNLTLNNAGNAPSVRALIVDMDQWVSQGIAPPPSDYPGIQPGTLVTLDQYRKDFPRIPGVAPPTVMSQLNLLDFGPGFSPVGGVLTVLPPLLGPQYQVFVPKPDKDGVGNSGIRPMQIRVPLGTNVGWNIRAPGHRAPNLCGPSTSPGSYIPFETTKAERLAVGDPRLSLQERYKNHEGFVNAVRKAAKQLESKRVLLPEDGNTFISAAQASNVLQ